MMTSIFYVTIRNLKLTNNSLYNVEDRASFRILLCPSQTLKQESIHTYKITNYVIMKKENTKKERRIFRLKNKSKRGKREGEKERKECNISSFF